MFNPLGRANVHLKQASKPARLHQLEVTVAYMNARKDADFGSMMTTRFQARLRRLKVARIELAASRRMFPARSRPSSRMGENEGRVNEWLRMERGASRNGVLFVTCWRHETGVAGKEATLLGGAAHPAAEYYRKHLQLRFLCVSVSTRQFADALLCVSALRPLRMYRRLPVLSRF